MAAVAVWKQWSESKSCSRKSIFDETERLIALSEKITDRYQSELSIVSQQAARDKENIAKLQQSITETAKKNKELEALNQANVDKIKELTHKVNDTSTAMRALTTLVTQLVSGATALYNQVVELGGEPVYTPPSVQKG